MRKQEAEKLKGNDTATVKATGETIVVKSATYFPADDEVMVEDITGRRYRHDELTK